MIDEITNISSADIIKNTENPYIAYSPVTEEFNRFSTKIEAVNWINELQKGSEIMNNPYNLDDAWVAILVNWR